MIKIYRAKPEIIEAVQFTGGNINTIRELTASSLFVRHNEFDDTHVEPILELRTDNGDVRIHKGDYIIKSKTGFRICKPRLFKLIYEQV